VTPPAQARARVMLVDDHGFVRAAIVQALTGPDLEVVAEASTAEEAFGRAMEVRPDILLVDIDLPGASGLNLVRDLAPRLPETRIVLLTVSTDQRDVTEAMRLGAAGYLTKDMDPDALLRAIRGVMQGDLAMPRRLAATTMRELADAARRRPGEGRTEGLSTLTVREEGILRMLSDGLTDREIGEALSISTRTVESHVGNILRKLDARNRADAARRYAEGL
jgi:DNA-binding NarL/FixJ family response regulator